MTKKTEIKTLGDWLAVFKDLDGYIANGGRLLDLPMGGWNELPDDHPAIAVIAETLGHERLMRLGRYFIRVGELVGTATVESVISEEQARALWRESESEIEPK